MNNIYINLRLGHAVSMIPIGDTAWCSVTQVSGSRYTAPLDWFHRMFRPATDEETKWWVEGQEVG